MPNNPNSGCEITIFLNSNSLMRYPYPINEKVKNKYKKINCIILAENKNFENNSSQIEYFLNFCNIRPLSG